MSTDLISRQAAIDVADAVWCVTGDKNVAKIWDQIKDLPAAHPEPPKKGKWIIYPLYPDGGEVYMCSECGKFGMPPYFNYCPNCGAKMGREKNAVD